MALGKVCIGSDVGGLTELIRDDKTGVIFHAGDAEHLASCIIGLIDDRGRMDRLRQAALAFVKREREWSTILRNLRGAMLAIPTRLAQRGLSANDVGLVDQEIRDVLSELGSS